MARRHASDAPMVTTDGLREVVGSPADVFDFAERTTLTDAAVGRVGIETEWFVVNPRLPDRPVALERTYAALGGSDPGLSGGSRITFEPGGQLELSGPPLALPEAVGAMSADLAAVRVRLADDGLLLAGLGVDPLRAPRRLLTQSRYIAMEAFFREGGFPAGRVMMCSTAALQVNLEAGPAAGWDERWRLAHALGPVLLSMFASSPVLAGRRTGQVSTRQRVWSAIDSTRTAPVADVPGPASARGPGGQWARYLLDARLMLVRDGDGQYVPVRDGSTFGDWVAGRGPVRRRPTVDDLSYHASTVFPPVRPRGWLELRYLDAQSAALWPVAVTVATALLDDPEAADVARDACEGVAGRWVEASVLGLAQPTLRTAARRCVTAAVEAAARLGVSPDLVAAVADFADTFVWRGRCPADAALASWRAGGAHAVLIDATTGVDAPQLTLPAGPRTGDRLNG
ncbi:MULTISPECIES: ergothioneine biosynthesis glutamate--cysteine ligase EgtA [unclassified Pseudofrankia]|uniref:ergothioneine biosynthesis glutamate--cysteine ligase EgtA n=1 Tax=unclassified Pseudofrankia TaxID=2994372 RepID=UPI0008DB10D1|nr:MULTISPECIES: ergothioneine biosynthesis glutamate--cysteine ligase EgtA [unclassified Pseudofrankia]MDT3442527.1 ergothioneine biosynthesis glutamate--cysteine ligase EgtA [Pseudofrankia sp. BMG5.37]OHV74690.1 ergothioneine biosynthesis glutamate--cysteine ligase EgtA [Pseudofrankia sp. BMG5.36]